MGNITEMFETSREFWGWAIERRQTNSTTTNPLLPWQQNLRQKWLYLGLCDISEILARSRGFLGSCYWM